MLKHMSRLPAGVLEQLEFLAHEIFETFANEGHLIGTALGQHRAFTSHGGESTASLTRDLVREAAKSASIKLGIDYRPSRGSGRQIAIIDGTRRRVFQIRSAQEIDHEEGGGFRVLATGDPFAGLECEALIRDEAWVLGWVRDRVAGGVAELMAGRVVGVSDHTVPVLLLEDVVRLAGAGTGLPPDRFEGDEDDLEGFSDFGDAAEDDDPGDLGQLGGAS
jgi:hypothetical protein